MAGNKKKLVLIVSVVITLGVCIGGGIQARASGGEEAVNVRSEESLFDNFDEMDYALFLETEVGYGVTGTYFRYGIYGDFLSSVQEGEEIYFVLNEKVLGKRLNFTDHEDWVENRNFFIQNLSPDLEWVIGRKYLDLAKRYTDKAFFQNEFQEREEGCAWAELCPFFIIKNEENESCELMDKKKIEEWGQLVADIQGWSYCIPQDTVKISCMDTYGKLLAVSEPDNQSIRIYDTRDWTMLQCISIDSIDADYPVLISQIEGNEERGWIIFSNGDTAWQMNYPEGDIEKLGNFMYDVTVSPDGKYRAFCTGNRQLDEIWQVMPDEKLNKLEDIYDRWNQVPVGWYVEELETGNKVHIPVETWEQDNRPIYGGRCVWLQKDKLLQMLDLREVNKRIQVNDSFAEIEMGGYHKRIEYPNISIYGDEDIANLINEEIYRTVIPENFAEYTNGVAQTEIGYDFEMINEELISIHFLGYHSLWGSYAEFDKGMNFDLHTGELISLNDLYTALDLKQLVEAAQENKEISIPDFPVTEEDIEEEINHFLELLETPEYLNRGDNFFIKDNHIYFIAPPPISMRQSIYVEISLEKVLE